jgi:hypothetical protein
MRLDALNSNLAGFIVLGGELLQSMKEREKIESHR